ncbi:phytanoyl-CoA dioxygenase family protein [Alkanindiges sp. WGS2144]|uniref:phytanoyl-CoA dioxygenase family protein n=1 Tax=Alkanindiges sp. WGS2144 TaxID=3366808 RepID=UPI00375093FE
MKFNVLVQEYKKIIRQDKGWFKTPLWTLAVITGAKSFLDNPVIGNSLFNQAGLHTRRVKLAAYLASRRRARLAKHLSPEDARFFQHNGFIIKENFLPAEQFKQLEHELVNTVLPARETLQGNTVTRRIALDEQALAKLPQARQLINQPYFHQLINYVGSFKVQPLWYIQSILSQVRKANPDPQTSLHSDTFHSSVKAWLFLTDVAIDEGPFVYVPGSHRLTPERLAWEHQRSIGAASADRMSARGSFRIQEAELAALGLPKPQAFAVPKNTLVVADTFGFHARGKSVRPSTRIEVWAYARRNPFLLWTGLDPLSLPFLNHKIIPLYWWILDELEKRHWKNNPWRPVGQLRAGDPARFIKK